MKKMIAIAMLAALAMAPMSHASFVKTWSFPVFTGTDGSTAGNPHTDADANQWGAYGLDRSTELAVTLLPWVDSSSSWWTSDNAAYVPGTKVIRGGGHATDEGMLSFSPGVNGEYSLTGTTSVYVSNNSGDGWRGIDLRILKVSSGGARTTLYEDAACLDGATLVFANVANLQNISLTTTDSLWLWVTSNAGGEYGEMGLADAGLGLVGQVPEPASLLLLGACALMLLKRPAA